MRYLILSVCVVWGVAACHSTSELQANAQGLSATLPQLDTSKEPGLLEQYHVGKFAVGGWVNQKLGQHFKPVQPNNPQAAVVYLYRPDSRWNQQEIAAANIFINGQRIPSLLNNHYYWIELPEGQYRVSTSRPLTVLHFQKPKYLDLELSAGQYYYLKYDEENPSRKSQSGPFMLVDEQIGRSEIAFTRLKSSSYNFVAQDPSGKVRHKAQELKPARYDQAQEVILVKPFKIWNPMTW